MTVDFKNSDSEGARLLYWTHGVISQPTYTVIGYFKRWGNPLTNIYDNYSTKTQEFAYRCFGPAALISVAAYLAKQASLPYIGLLSIGGLMALEGGRIALHLIAFASQKKNYIHVRTAVPETLCANPKIMTWNILGFPAGMHYTCGGLPPLKDRFPRIAQLINKENPDIIVIQECLLDASTFELFISYAFTGV